MSAADLRDAVETLLDELERENQMTKKKDRAIAEAIQNHPRLSESFKRQMLRRLFAMNKKPAASARCCGHRLVMPQRPDTVIDLGDGKLTRAVTIK